MTGLLPFSSDWADALKASIAGDAQYRVVGRGWMWPIALVLSAAPALGYPDDLAVELELSRGECTAARLLPAGDVTVKAFFEGKEKAAVGLKVPTAGAFEIKEPIVVGPVPSTSTKSPG